MPACLTKWSHKASEFSQRSSRFELLSLLPERYDPKGRYLFSNGELTWCMVSPLPHELGSERDDGRGPTSAQFLNCMGRLL